MALKQRLGIILFAILGLVVAIPNPHVGMIDTAALRDVGVIYTEPNFQGDRAFIFEVKGNPKCLPLGEDVLSVAICKTDVSCTFYTGSNCESGRDNFSVRVGCGDAAEVNSPKGEHFSFYSCGAANASDAADYTVETVPHNANADAGLYMGT